MTNRWVGVTIDCVDVERIAGFWSALLDRPKMPTTVADRQERPPPLPLGIRQITPPHVHVNDLGTK